MSASKAHVLLLPGFVTGILQPRQIRDQIPSDFWEHFEDVGLQIENKLSVRLFPDLHYQQNYHALRLLREYLNRYAREGCKVPLLVVNAGALSTSTFIDWQRLLQVARSHLLQDSTDAIRDASTKKKVNGSEDNQEKKDEQGAKEQTASSPSSAVAHIPWEACLLDPRAHPNPTDHPDVAAGIIVPGLDLFYLFGEFRNSSVMLLAPRYLERMRQGNLVMDVHGLEEIVGYSAKLIGLCPGVVQDPINDHVPPTLREFGEMRVSVAVGAAKEKAALVPTPVVQDAKDQLNQHPYLITEGCKRLILFDYHAHLPKERDPLMAHFYRFLISALPHLAIHFTQHYPNNWAVPPGSNTLVMVSQFAIQEAPFLLNAGHRVVNLISQSNYLEIYRGNTPASQLSQVSWYVNSVIAPPSDDNQAEDHKRLNLAFSPQFYQELLNM
jgi:hypothetical protein